MYDRFHHYYAAKLAERRSKMALDGKFKCNKYIHFLKISRKRFVNMKDCFSNKSLYSINNR